MKLQNNYKCSLMFIGIITAALISAACGKTIYVDIDADGANNGTSWENAYKFLQYAMEDAEFDNKPIEIRIAQGTYTPDIGSKQTPGEPNSTIHPINGVTLSGGYAGIIDPNLRDPTRFETIISGHLSNGKDCYIIIIALGNDETAVLDGLTITSASDNLMLNWQSNLTVTNCIFRGATDECCGMYNIESDPNIRNCTFTDNITDENGGGMYNDNSRPNLSDCVFIGNSAEKGGGIYNVNSYPKLNNCIFINNRASMGGGMYNNGVGDYLFPSSGALVKQCTFSANYATSQQLYFEGGGAIFSQACYLNISNCLFTGNQASKGGGLYCCDNWRVWLSNCTFDGNYARGSAISTGSEHQSSPSNINIINCIMWDSSYNINNFDDSNIDISYSNVKGGFTGEGNIDQDPLFAEPGYWADANDPNVAADPADPNALWVDGDYHLKSEYDRWNPDTQTWITDDVTSPCIDAGDPDMRVGDEPFPNGVLINMGAYGGTDQASMSLSNIPSTVNVNDSDNGSQVTLIQGQILAVTLESNPTTGYSWARVEKQDSILVKYGDSTYIPSEQEEGTVGAGGWEMFYFRTAAVGRETLEMVYRRSWETDVEPAKTFSIDVIIN